MSPLEQIEFWHWWIAGVALVIIDFLVRHGHITPDEPHYEALLAGLHAGPAGPAP